MTPRHIVSRFAAAALAAALVGLPACSSSDDTQPSGPVARFTPDLPTPGAGSVALLAGSSSGASVTVRVTVTGIDDVFGAAFRVDYDTTALQYGGFDDSGSFLRQGVTDDDVLFLADAINNPGQIVITATRLDPTLVETVDVGATADLIVLNFAARKPIAGGAAEGRLDFADPKQLCDGTVAAPLCGSIAVTWSGGGVSAQ